MFKINQLIIIGGVSAVGKSTFLKNLLEGELPNLSDLLGIDYNCPPYLLYPGGISKVQQTHANNIIIHYDFYHQHSLHGSLSNLEDLIRQASYVTVITLCASSSELHSRMSLRIKEKFRSLLLKPRKNKIMRFFSLWKKYHSYKNSSNLVKLYEYWSKFIEEHAPTEHLLIDSTETIYTAATPYEEAKLKKILQRR